MSNNETPQSVETISAVKQEMKDFRDGSMENFKELPTLQDFLEYMSIKSGGIGFRLDFGDDDE